ncbi:MAG: tol-pal system protein YbgF [Gammaproteobacteria bacterium]|nr:tol-pal system protein YbgF [Gammaproteobacteria bacterium]
MILSETKRVDFLFSVRVLIVIPLILTGFFMPVYAESEAYYKNRPLDVRVDRLERLMSSQKQLELLYRMKQLQEENQQLRGSLEEQSNEIHLLKQQQRELYTDLNRRLSQMEGSDSNTDNNALSSEPNLSQSKDILIPKKEDLPVVLDKSSYEQAKYGVTEREEIAVTQSENQSAIEQPTDKAIKTKPSVYKKIPMTEKQQLEEQKAYQKAYDELRGRRYSKARDSFIAFIQKYPGGRYAHIAQYWVAESSYAQQNYEQAITDYQLLLDVYPLSPKKAEAELKKAYSFNELGNKKIARQTLNQLLLNYPDTTEAGQAKRLLKQL